jgi:hypothetical protein
MDGSEEVWRSRPSRRPAERLAWPLRRIELKSNYDQIRTGRVKRKADAFASRYLISASRNRKGSTDNSRKPSSRSIRVNPVVRAISAPGVDSAGLHGMGAFGLRSARPSPINAQF